MAAGLSVSVHRALEGLNGIVYRIVLGVEQHSLGSRYRVVEIGLDGRGDPPVSCGHAGTISAHVGGAELFGLIDEVLQALDSDCSLMLGVFVGVHRLCQGLRGGPERGGTGIIGHRLRRGYSRIHGGKGGLISPVLVLVDVGAVSADRHQSALGFCDEGF